MISMTQRGGVALAAFALIAVAGSASADISSTVFSITATLDNGAGPSYSFEVAYDPSNHDGAGNFFWSLGDSMDVVDDNGQNVFTLETASVHIVNNAEAQGGQSLGLNFNAVSGNSSTVFSVDSAVLSFAAIANSSGRATASVSVTDLNGDGATYSPAAVGAYSAFYNGGGTNFQDLITSPVTAAANSTTVSSDVFPAVGFANIGTTLTDIDSSWNFTLSAGDLASGTSEFEIIPAPASVVLGLVALTGLRRRR